MTASNVNFDVKMQKIMTTANNNIDRTKTPMCEWITLFDPAKHPGLSLDDRHKLVLKNVKMVVDCHSDPYPASTLAKVIQDDPLSSYYDPSDDDTCGDENEVQFICKV